MKGLVQNDRKKSVALKVKRMYANLDKKKKRQRGLRLSAVTGVSKGLSDFEFPLFFSLYEE